MNKHKLWGVLTPRGRLMIEAPFCKTKIEALSEAALCEGWRVSTLKLLEEGYSAVRVNLTVEGRV